MAAALSVSMLSCAFIKVNDDYDDGEESQVVWGNDSFFEKEYAVEEFTVVESSIPADIVYVQGAPSVRIQGPDNIVGMISVSCGEDGVLSIRKTDKSTKFRRVGKLDVVVSSASLEGVRISGSGSFEADRVISSKDFSVEVSGSGEADIDYLKAVYVKMVGSGACDFNVENIDCESVDIIISGAGDCEIGGKAGRASVSISGAGDVDATELVTDNFTSKISGAGSVRRPRNRR